jgi:hypothetical protein
MYAFIPRGKKPVDIAAGISVSAPGCQQTHHCTWFPI